MKKYLWVLIIAVCVMAFPGCASDNTPKAASPILANTPYYISAVLPGSFDYHMRTNDHSFIQFKYGFQMMELHLDVARAETEAMPTIEFLVIKSTHKDNNITATVQRIHNGEIVRYEITSDAQKIYITASVSERLTATINNGEETVTITNNVPVLIFTRTEPPPSYIGRS
jgi:hypothetical protein